MAHLIGHDIYCNSQSAVLCSQHKPDERPRITAAGSMEPGRKE